MSAVKRIFRQQSARVASSSTSDSFSRNRPRPTTTDADEEDEKLVISTSDDTALILSRRQRPRCPPLHSNSIVSLFSDKTSDAIAQGLTNHHSPKRTEPATASAVDAEDIKRQGVTFRSTSPSGRLRCVTAPVGQVTSVVVAKSPRARAYSRAPTFDNLAHFGRAVDGFRLTTQQRSLIQQCWHAMGKKGKSSESAGSFVFRWMFKKEPRLKHVFGLQHIPDDQLTDDPLFQKHAHAFSDVLELVVDSVGSEKDSTSLLDDTMGPFLCSYGAEHALMEKRQNSEDARFQSTDWEIFAAAVREFAIDSWKTGGSWTPLGPFQKRNEALHAWHVLVHFIVTKVKRGYELEKEKLTSTTKRSPGSTSGVSPVGDRRVR